jgi:hypothetical protein
VAKPSRPTVTITLTPAPSPVPLAHRVRRLLKYAGSVCGLRCVRVELPAEIEATNEKDSDSATAAK